jgi:hypothetical protein
MTVFFKFSNLALNGDSTYVNGPILYYGNCEHYIYTKNTYATDYPRIQLSQVVLGLNTTFSIYMDMGIGANNANSGVFAKSKGVVFINGTAPFVYDGQLTSSPLAGITNNSYSFL